MVRLVDYGLSTGCLPSFLSYYGTSKEQEYIYSRAGRTRGDLMGHHLPNFCQIILRSKVFCHLFRIGINIIWLQYNCPAKMLDLPGVLLQCIYYVLGRHYRRYRSCRVGEVVFSLPSLLSIQPFLFPLQIYITSQEEGQSTKSPNLFCKLIQCCHYELSSKI